MDRQASQKWTSYATGLAVVCLLGLALTLVFGLATPQVRTILMVGILVSGTIALVGQARQKCPHCGEPYGYRFKVVNTHLCPKCGEDTRAI